MSLFPTITAEVMKNVTASLRILIRYAPHNVNCRPLAAFITQQ